MIKTLLKYPLRPRQFQQAQFAFSTKGKKKYEIPYLTEYSQLFEDSKIIEKIIPRHIADGKEFQAAYPCALEHSCSGSEITGDEPFDLADTNAINKALNEPIYDLLDRGGKRWRPVLGLIMARCLGRTDLEDFEKNKDVYYACGLAEIIHNGSLMIDDVQDGSEKRRGDLCTYKKFGIDTAVNAGNFMYFGPILQLPKYIPIEKQIACHTIQTEEMARLHFGQSWDIQWHNEPKKMPLEPQYYQMVENKTSCLPRMLSRFIAELTDQNDETKEKINKFINLLGAAFQIMDDVIAVDSKDYRKERGTYAEDIQEGKRTLMVIHAYYYGWKGDRLLQILNMKTSDEELHKEAVDILREDEAILYARNAAKNVMVKAWEDIEKILPEGDAKEDLYNLTQFLVNRTI